MKGQKRLAEDIADHLLSMNYGDHDSKIGDRLAIMKTEHGKERQLGGRIRSVIVADILKHLSKIK